MSDGDGFYMAREYGRPWQGWPTTSPLHANQYMTTEQWEQSKHLVVELLRSDPTGDALTELILMATDMLPENVELRERLDRHKEC